MPFTHDDVITAAQLLVEQAGLDPFIAVEDVTRVFRAAMHAIDTELDRVLEGESDHASAHALVLDYLPGQLRGLERNTVVAQEHVTLLLGAQDVQAALIEHTIDAASDRVRRAAPPDEDTPDAAARIRAGRSRRAVRGP